MEREFVTAKMYLDQIYKGFCKDYNYPSDPTTGFRYGYAFQRQLKERSMQDLLMFVKEQGVGSVEAREKDKKNHLTKGGAFECWIDTYAINQDIVLCLVNDYYEGLRDKREETTMTVEGNSGDRIKAYKLKKDKRTGIRQLILVNDPTALDELPDFGPHPPRKEWESAVDYASRIAQEAEYKRIEMAAKMAGLMSQPDGPSDDTSEDEQQTNRIKSINEYYGFPDS